MFGFHDGVVVPNLESVLSGFSEELSVVGAWWRRCREKEVRNWRLSVQPSV